MKRFSERLAVLCVAAHASLACGSSSSNGVPSESNGATSGGGAASGSGSGADPNGGSGGTAPGDPRPPIGTGGETVQPVDPSTIQTALPTLPTLTNVVGQVRDDSVGISFDPVDGAVDYRVYVLPKNDEVQGYPDGSLTVTNAVYRCAGNRQAVDLKNNLREATVAVTRYLTATIDADADKNTLGHVYVTPGDRRAAVYAVAMYPMDGESGWRESRPKIYTTSADERLELLAKGGRDDGIVFYVPSRAEAGETKTIYRSEQSEVVAGQGWTKYKEHYFDSEGMAARQKDTLPPSPAFEALTAPAEGTRPLMVVPLSGEAHTHDELTAGAERFHRAAYQGNGPLWHLEWAGLSEPTTLVVEALATGCPYQGLLSPEHVEVKGHQPLLTLEDLQQAAKTSLELGGELTGEVFINGQHDNDDRPVPLARAFLNVEPKRQKIEEWDFYQGFDVGTDLGERTAIAGCSDLNCGRWKTKDFDISTYRLERVEDVTLLALGTFLGQLWVVHSDYGGDVTGKVRVTANTKGKVDDDSFLHATMSVDMVTTDRRYPQMIISDLEAPVNEGMESPDHDSLLIQTIQGPNMRLEVQAIHGLVNGKSWDVNNQAKEHRLIDYNVAPDQPADSVFEHAGMDRMTRLDLFVSTSRLYAFMDGAPAGCLNIPPDVDLTGDVTVTWGDVLYHEGAADEQVCVPELPYGFLHRHQCSETKRHFDDLGFKSGVKAPAWDESRFPCRDY